MSATSRKNHVEPHKISLGCARACSVLFIRVHSGFGHGGNGRVINMIKPQSMETTYFRVSRERVHWNSARLSECRVPEATLYTSHLISVSSHLVSQPPVSQPGVSHHRLMRPGYGSQNTTCSSEGSPYARVALLVGFTVNLTPLLARATAVGDFVRISGVLICASGN